MRAGLQLLLAAAAATSNAAAEEQTLEARFLSEFRRVSPDGEITAPDSPGTPREIISPAIIRNGYKSFHIVVTGPPGKDYMLFIASNPDDLLRPVLYRITGPDRLEQMKDLNVPGKFNSHGVGVYWLDVWTPKSTPVRRIRLEAQLNFGEEFRIAPLELRVQLGSVPEGPLPVLAEPPPSESHAAAGPFSLLAQSLCTQAKPAPRAAAASDNSLSILAKIARNAGQDMLLANQSSVPAAKREEWCAAPRDNPDPEAYLRLRDAIWRASQ